MNFNKIKNPILDREPECATRDPALVYHNGLFICFHTAVEYHNNRYRLFLDVTESYDLIHWTKPRRLTTSELNFSSPGNIIRFKDRWVLCLQSYPIKHGQIYGSEDSRLWRMESLDLKNWSEPVLLKKEGCQVKWTRSHRQIDPYIIQHDGRYWCFYKTDGCIGLMISEDLNSWQDICQNRPVLSAQDTPDGSTLENPCIIFDKCEYIMFFSPCRPGRGIGMARSKDLINWYDVHYLNFPKLPWALGGPTAAMVLDMRKKWGKWLMAFHGDRKGPHGAALGLAWSDDLENWECN